MSLRKKLKLNDAEESESLEQDFAAESQYFKPDSLHSAISDNISDSLLKIEDTLVLNLKSVIFKPPVHCVYNPLEYANFTHSMFVKKYCCSKKKVLFLGLNPGPFGMAQTGVPFGEVKITRDWLKIEGPVNKPQNEISARPVKGFECPRSEVSGKRFWSFMQEQCGTPEIFFRNCYMHNYCPLLLMKKEGANVTPADLKNSESAELTRLCDESLSEIIKLLQVEIVVGIGRFAQKRAAETVKKHGLKNVRVHFLLHPSPRVPGNENWGEKAAEGLRSLGILQYLC